MDPIQRYYNKYWIVGGAKFSGELNGYAPNFRRWMSRNLDKYDRSRPILEVGCGDGCFSNDLSKFSNQVSAIDISDHQIAINREKYPHIQFTAHDLGKPMPFENDHFGAIWCSEVLEHLLDPAFAIQEMFRVLKSDGFIMLTVPHHGGFKNLCIALFKWDHHFDPEYSHIRFFTRNTLGRIVAKAGFQEIKMETCGMGMPFRDMLIATNLLLTARKP